MSYGCFFAANDALKHLLFQTTAEVVNGWAKSRKFDVGFCSVLHTFGGVLNYHPHIHMLITAGGLGESDTLIKIEHIPWNTLKSRFRAIFVKKLRKWVRENTLDVPKSITRFWQKKIGVSNFFEMLRTLFAVTWYVHVGERLRDSEYTVRYIGRYAKRPSISEAKLVKYDGETVVFEHKDKRLNRVIRIRLGVTEFIGRLVRHIPKKGFRMIRYGGVYSTRGNEKCDRLRKAIWKKYCNRRGGFRFTGKVAKSWRERVIEMTGEDPLMCPWCGETMRLVAIAFRIRDGTRLRVIGV